MDNTTSLVAAALVLALIIILLTVLQKQLKFSKFYICVHKFQLEVEFSV